MKTHCPKGHELTGSNVLKRKSRQGRTCGICQRKHARRYEEKLKAERLAKRRPTQTGFPGVRFEWDFDPPRYSSTIRVNRKDIYLGCFKTGEEAHAAYIKAKKAAKKSALRKIGGG
jgi:hypothetical protein